MTLADLLIEYRAQATAIQGLAETFHEHSPERAEAIARAETWTQAADRLALVLEALTSPSVPSVTPDVPEVGSLHPSVPNGRDSGHSDPPSAICDGCRQLYEVQMCRRCWEIELLPPNGPPQEPTA